MYGSGLEKYTKKDKKKDEEVDIIVRNSGGNKAKESKGEYKTPKLRLKKFKAPKMGKSKKETHLPKTKLAENRVSDKEWAKSKKAATKKTKKIKKITPRMRAEAETDAKLELMMEKMRMKSEKSIGDIIKGLK